MWVHTLRACAYLRSHVVCRHAAAAIQERVKLIREARSGGTVTPEALAKLQEYITAGRITVHQRTVDGGVLVASEDRDGCRSGWQWRLSTTDGDVVHASGLLLATGTTVDVRRDPMLRTLLAMTPPDSVCEGLPILTAGCQWPVLSDGRRLPVFCMGAYAQLVIGPNAGNLFGARIAAAQVWFVSVCKPLAVTHTSQEPMCACLLCLSECAPMACVQCALQVAAALSKDVLFGDVHHATGTGSGSLGRDSSRTTSQHSKESTSAAPEKHRAKDDMLEPARAAYTGAGGNMFAALALDLDSDSD